MSKKKQHSGSTNSRSDTWSIRGVSAETRAAVKKAARRRGLTLGAWIEEELRRAATETLSQAVPATSEGQGTSEAMKAILERLEALEASQKDQAPPPSFWKRFFG